MEATVPAGVLLEASQVTALRFAGFVAFSDPIRPTACEVIAQLRQAGIAVKIITGDQPATARAIARDLALPSDGTVLTGPEIDTLSEADLRQAAESASVFARVTSWLALALTPLVGRAIGMAA